MFRSQMSSLFVAQRDGDMNNGKGTVPKTDVDYTDAFKIKDYLLAQTKFESAPHDLVHSDVGGPKGFMSKVLTAAQDPIFYPHHANVDRLWNLWLAQGGGRSDPINSVVWTTRKFTFFDKNKNPVIMTPCDVLRAAEQLNYKYEGEPEQIKQFCGPNQPSASLVFTYAIVYSIPFPPPVVLTGQPTFAQFELPAEILQRVQKILQDPSKQLYFEILDAVSEIPPGASWEVYFGLPAGVTPDPTSPFYVGKLAMFINVVRSGMHHGESFRAAHFEFDVTTAMAIALQHDLHNIPVTFVPRSILVDGQPRPPDVQSPVSFTEARLRVATEKEE